MIRRLGDSTTCQRGTTSPVSEPEPTQANTPTALSAYAGGQIVFTSSRDGDNEVYLMDADGSNQVNLSNNPSAGDGQPVIGPNGKIAFISDRDGNLEIYTMDRDGGNQVRLTNFRRRRGLVGLVARWEQAGVCL